MLRATCDVRDSDRRALESIGGSLPDVEVTTGWGQPALKVGGRMFACGASHKSAEPNTLVVWMDFEARDALVADEPDIYYLKDHYRDHPCVLVRLTRVRRDALRDLIAGAYRFVSAKARKRTAKPRARGPAGARTRRAP